MEFIQIRNIRNLMRIYCFGIDLIFVTVIILTGMVPDDSSTKLTGRSGEQIDERTEEENKHSKSARRILGINQGRHLTVNDEQCNLNHDLEHARGKTAWTQHERNCGGTWVQTREHVGVPLLYRSFFSVVPRPFLVRVHL